MRACWFVNSYPTLDVRYRVSRMRGLVLIRAVARFRLRILALGLVRVRLNGRARCRCRTPLRSSPTALTTALAARTWARIRTWLSRVGRSIRHMQTAIRHVPESKRMHISHMGADTWAGRRSPSARSGRAATTWARALRAAWGLAFACAGARARLHLCESAAAGPCVCV